MNPQFNFPLAVGIITVAGAFLANAQPQAPRGFRPGAGPADTGSGTLQKRVANDAGSPNAPLLFCLGMHIEPFGATPSKLAGGSERTNPPAGGPGLGRGARQPDYHTEFFFKKHVAEIRIVAGLVERHGGRLTVQAQTPFTEMLAQEKETLLADLEKRGHEIGLHFHEDAHLGRNGGRLPVETWAKVMQEEIDLLKKTGVTQVRYWSGGNLYPGVLDAAASAGLDVMSDYKNPRSQRADEKLLAVGPWRPSAGPKENDLAGFARHSASGKIVYLPDGLFPRTDFNSMRRAETPGGDWTYFDFLTESLQMSLRAARPDPVNVFHITVHAGEFRGGRGEVAKPFNVIDQWLTQVIEPLVKAGKVKWATFSQMADANKAWEQKNPGVDPRGNSPTKSAAATAPSERSAGLRPRALEGERENSNAPDRRSALQGPGFMTFAVNTHDWAHLDESADTILRLIAIFEKHQVRGDFYLTAPITEAYAQKQPEVIRRLKESGMTISYHVRAPHPLWSGFGEPLRGLDGATLAAKLRAYETHQLDLRTGALNRDQPGGYSYVAQVFGRKPVAVGASSASPAVREAAFKLYSDLGAQAAVV